MKPQEKKMIKIFWSCGVHGCDVYHETKDKAAKCIEKDRRRKEWAEFKKQRDLARNAMGRDIVKMRRTGFTLRQIAEKHSKSIERIRQIEAKYLRENRRRDIATKANLTAVDVSEVPIDLFIADACLSVRTESCLRNARVEKLGDVLSMTEKELLQIKNFGRRSLVELKDAINKMKIKAAK